VELDHNAWLLRLIAAEPEERSNGACRPEASPNPQFRRQISKLDALHGRLAVAASEGDHAAFALIVNRHKDWISRYLKRHIDDEEEAHDALQDILLSAWRYLGRYDPKRSFKIWLSQIVLNKTRDRARRTMVRRTTLESLHTIELAAPSSSISQETVLVREEALLRIETAMDGLPSQYREALVLTVIEDLSYSDAAARLGINRKVMENRVYRAKGRLASMLRATDLRDLVCTA
jgi:RNA polymerase sigma factor (sigma-70 family)